MARAVLLSVLAHAFLLGGAWAISWSRGTPVPETVVEAPLGSVFVREEAAAPPAPVAPSAAAPAPAPAEENVGGGAKQPAPAAPAAASAGLPSGTATPTTRIQPAYPPMSVRLGEEGEAAFVLELTAEGAVASLRLERSSGHPRLDEAAAAALRDARFEPSRGPEGAPAPATKRFRVEFRLKGAR